MKSSITDSPISTPYSISGFSQQLYAGFQSLKHYFFYDKDHENYPLKVNRYFSLGWNRNFQSCYTENEIQLLKQINKEYQVLNEDSKNDRHFQLDIEKKIYDWWTCAKPSYDIQALTYPSNSFTLANREVKDASFFPLWQYADNMAKQIANWQAERAKNQRPELLNDPVMLVLEELKIWFFEKLSELGNKKEDLELIAKRQHYIKKITHIIPNFGPDQSHLHEIQNSLTEVAHLLSSHFANKQLPDLLSDLIVKGKNLEATVGTYLHFLFINEPVADNFAANFMENKSANCDLSPVCKIYRVASDDCQPQSDVDLNKFQQLNRFYHFEKVKNPEGGINILMKLKNHLLDTIKFSKFVKAADKENYLDTLSLLDALMNVRKTLENFKELQSSLGTYVFAIYYLENSNKLALNYMDLINRVQLKMNGLLQAANEGLAQILKGSTYDRQQEYFFEKNLHILETKVSKDTTAAKALEDYCFHTRESTLRYRDAMSKLVSHVESGKAQEEVKLAMQKLITQINDINSLLPALIGKSSLTLDSEDEKKLADGMFASGNMKALNDQANFDEARWDETSKEDLSTHLPIYTYRLYKNREEVGSAEFLGHPFLCWEEQNERLNVIHVTGILKGMPITNVLNIEDLCHYFPPTLLDRVCLSAKNGAIQGFLRGNATVLALSLRSLGISPGKSDYLSRMAYYGAIFTMNVHRYYEVLREEDELAHLLHAMYAALLNTGQLIGVDLFLNGTIHLLQKASESLAKHQFPLISRAIKQGSSLLRFGIFSFHAATNGLPEIAASMASGVVSEIATEKVGSYLLEQVEQRSLRNA